MKPEQAVIMSNYNQWMNKRLYEVCSELSDEERKLDKGAFFDSIHGTLNHSLLGDKVWLGRFKGKLFSVEGLNQILFEDFTKLREERDLIDRRIGNWAKGLGYAELNSTFRFTSIVNPTPRSCELSIAVMHFFNHQTHHRGQITTLLSQCGKDIGVTDLLGLPGLVSVDDT